MVTREYDTSMPLLRKRRRLRFGFPEYMGLVLLSVTVALAGYRILEWADDVHAHRTTGRVVQVIGGNTTAPRVLFTYAVDGVLYRNTMKTGTASGTLASLLPAPVMARLAQRGIFDFQDLPEEARRQIREGTAHTLDELEPQYRQALQSHGYRNAEELRLALLYAMDGAAKRPGSARAMQQRAVGASVPVLYDPADPGDSAIARHHGIRRRAILAQFAPVIFALVTCLYFGGVYPRLKSARRA